MDGTNNVENSSSDVDCTQSVLSTASSREELIWDNYSPPLHSCANGCHFLIHRRLTFQCASCGRPTSCSSCASSVSASSVSAKWIDVQRAPPPGIGPPACSEDNPIPETNASAGGDDDESPMTEESKGLSMNNSSSSSNTAARRRRSDTNWVQHNNNCGSNNNNTESSNTSSQSLDFWRPRCSYGCEEEDSTTSMSSLVDGGVSLLSCLRFSDTASAPSSSMSEGRYQVMSDTDRRGTPPPPPPPRSRSLDAVRQRTCADGAAAAAAAAKLNNCRPSSCVRFNQTLKTRYKDDKYNCLSILKARECDDSSSSSSSENRSYVVLCSGSDRQFFENCLPMDRTAERREWRIDCNRHAKDPCRARKHEFRTKRYRCRPAVDVDDEVLHRNQRVRWCDRCNNDALETGRLSGRRSSSRPMTDGSEGRHGRCLLGGLGSDDGRGSYFVVTDPSLTSSEDVDQRCPFVENDCERFGREFYYEFGTTYDPDETRRFAGFDDCDCRFVRFSDVDIENEIDYCVEGEVETCESEQELLLADELDIEDEVLSCEYPEFIPPLEYLFGKATISIEGDLETTRPSSRMFSVSPVFEQEADDGIVSGRLSNIYPVDELEVDETFEPDLVAPLQGRRKSSHVAAQLAPTLDVLSRPSSMVDRSVKFSTADLSSVVDELKKPVLLMALIENFPIVRRTTVLKTEDSRDFRRIESYFNKQSNGIGHHIVMYTYNTAEMGMQRLFGMESQQRLTGGQMVSEQRNTIASIVTAYPLTSEVGNGPYPPIGGLPLSFSADAGREESMRPSASSAAAAVQSRPSALQEGVVDATSTTSVVRLHKRSDSNPYGLTITHFAPHHEQYMVTAREDKSVEPSFNRVEAVPAVEDLDIPVQSFTDSSKYKMSSSAPPREPSIKIAKKSDSNLKCLKELVAAATSGQRSSSTTTTASSTTSRYSDDGRGFAAGGLSEMLLEPLIGQIDVILKNSLSRKYTCSSVTQVMSRPAKTPLVTGGDSCRCARQKSDKTARCGSRDGRSWLRFLSARTISDRSNSCDESRPEPHCYAMKSAPEGGGRGGRGRNRPNITSAWIDRYNPPQSMFYNDPPSHDDCPGRTNREDSGTESITTIYSRLPASSKMRSTLADDATLPTTTKSCIPSRFYSYSPEPKPSSAVRCGRQKSRTVEFAATCKPSDDIISSTVIASRKRHPKTKKCDDEYDDDKPSKDVERKYKTLKHFCIKEFGRTRSLFDTLKPGYK